MSNYEMKKLDMSTTDIVNNNILKIGEMFPNVIDNGMINFERLKQELSYYILDDKKEKYQLTWPGKNKAIVNANSKINKTLRPIIEKSSNFKDTNNIYI